MRAILVVLLIGITSAGLSLIADPPQMTFAEEGTKGTVTVREGKIDVLTYRFGDQLQPGLEPKHTRSGYIHPLFSLDGAVLTEDFPKDHLHHHGVFWTWPVVKTRGLNTQTWHSVAPSLRQYFVRWLKREVGNGTATLSVENAWKLRGEEVVARETVTLHVYPSEMIGRAIDLELVIQALGGPLELQGAQDQNKGYGGLCIRGAPMLTGAALTTNQGLMEKDTTNVSFLWADMSTEKCGIAIFVSPSHPDFPPKFFIRNSYAGILNVSWPGLERTVLKPDRPVTLSYRIYVHRGNAAAGRVKQAYEQYLSAKQNK